MINKKYHEIIKAIQKNDLKRLKVVISITEFSEKELDELLKEFELMIVREDIRLCIDVWKRVDRQTAIELTQSYIDEPMSKEWQELRKELRN